MIGLPLTAAEQKAFEAALLADHAVSTRVQVLDMDQHVVGEVTGGVLSGQVDVDSSADVERTCQLEVLDPGNTLHLLGNSPTDPPLYATRMIRIYYRVFVTALWKWVDVPVFTGPISKADETDNRGGVAIEGQGKESMLTGPTHRAYAYGKGEYTTSVISNVLSLNGEQFRQITRWQSALTAPLAIAPTQAPWPVLRSLARGLVASASTWPWLFYDGAGIVHLRSYSGVERWHFGPEQLLAEPKTTFDTGRIRNVIVVTGNDTGGSKAPVQATARAPRGHAYSPENLGRGGCARFLREDIQADVTSVAQAQQIANSTLANRLEAGVDVEFSTVPIPHLEPRDVIRVTSHRWSWPLQITKWSLPLGGAAMTHGRHTQVRPRMKATARGRYR